ncbi:Homoserine O-acetyltransferase [Flavobacterium columnare]|uniref:Alpha/beta fold hydrolase n=2 Tax=Flavobacterium TaxID=237 RepID=A0ABW8PMX9_9FLAO|nr:alpha/beta fold hydrolase [Flavobacterium columnare]SPE76380.1 Homoserine O-acetyltransferase [Flavobacterium columnare]
MSKLQKIDVFNFKLENEKRISFLNLTYQTFGQPLGTAPIVVVNHALTGNSNVAGEKGWWKALIGDGKTIDTQHFTIVAFNIIGNGFEGGSLIENYTDFTTRDIAKLFWEGLESLGVKNVFALIGGSLGGGIVWEMAFLKPKAMQYVIPIASNYKANDWLIANVKIQDDILNHSSQPIKDARKHAMMLYRSPLSIDLKFQQEYVNGAYAVENWLDFHGQSLQTRFSLSAYKLMNHLLRTIGKSVDEMALQLFLNETTAVIHQVAIDSDGLFVAYENENLHHRFCKQYNTLFLHTLNSVHGHDAFLIEYEQLGQILWPIFNFKTTKNVSYQS